MAQSLILALVHVPGSVQIERARLKQFPQPEAWDEQAAVRGRAASRADVALYGEVRRNGGDVSIQPRYVEIRGERGRARGPRHRGRRRRAV